MSERKEQLAAEYQAALCKVFVGHPDACIIITSRREVFSIYAANYGVDMGWLTGEWYDLDEQSTAYVYRLTPAGREHFKADPQ